jgi:hypothetical protein
LSAIEPCVESALTTVFLSIWADAENVKKERNMMKVIFMCVKFLNDRWFIYKEV